MTSKQRWALCRKHAKKLEIQDGRVFQILHILEENELVAPLLEGSFTAIDAAKQIEASHMPDNEPPQSSLEAKAGDIKLMLWSVGKIGCMKRAESAFNAVKAQLKDA